MSDTESKSPSKMKETNGMEEIDSQLAQKRKPENGDDGPHPTKKQCKDDNISDSEELEQENPDLAPSSPINKETSHTDVKPGDEESGSESQKEVDDEEEEEREGLGEEEEEDTEGEEEEEGEEEAEEEEESGGEEADDNESERGEDPEEKESGGEESGEEDKASDMEDDKEMIKDVEDKEESNDSVGGEESGEENDDYSGSYYTSSDNEERIVPDRFKLQVLGSDEAIIRIDAVRTKPLELLFETYSQLVGLAREKIEFFYLGSRLLGSETPASLDLKPEDKINAEFDSPDSGGPGIEPEGKINADFDSPDSGSPGIEPEDKVNAEFDSSDSGSPGIEPEDKIGAESDSGGPGIEPGTL